MALTLPSNSPSRQELGAALPPSPRPQAPGGAPRARWHTPQHQPQLYATGKHIRHQCPCPRPHAHSLPSVNIWGQGRQPLVCPSPAAMAHRPTAGKGAATTAPARAAPVGTQLPPRGPALDGRLARPLALTRPAPERRRQAPAVAPRTRGRLGEAQATRLGPLARRASGGPGRRPPAARPHSVPHHRMQAARAAAPGTTGRRASTPAGGPPWSRRSVRGSPWPTSASSGTPCSAPASRW